MNERDKRDVTIVVGLCAAALIVTYPKAAVVAVGGAALLLGGTIWGVRSLQS